MEYENPVTITPTSTTTAVVKITRSGAGDIVGELTVPAIGSS